MNKMKQLKAMWEYEKDVPRCENCKSFCQTFVKLTHDSLTKRVHQHCNLGGFNCAKTSVCNKWTSKTGEVLV